MNIFDKINLINYDIFISPRPSKTKNPPPSFYYMPLFTQLYGPPTVTLKGLSHEIDFDNVDEN
jgi:hypothetical protein